MAKNKSAAKINTCHWTLADILLTVVSIIFFSMQLLIDILLFVKLNLFETLNELIQLI